MGKAEARELRWQLTGYVDDVRPHVRGSSVYVIPLRVGGGTRIKVFEAMAMGCPVVSRRAARIFEEICRRTEE